VVSGVTYRARSADRERHCTRDGQNTTIGADRVLITAGRTPNIESLGLAEHGTAISSKGGIVVVDRMRTIRNGIYAAGDATSCDQFVCMPASGAVRALWRQDMRAEQSTAADVA
jgi:pyruvate/2-oxoglutarate dehydrogenase complex dihydrolipoamide dehydrogenase (E3) component